MRQRLAGLGRQLAATRTDPMLRNSALMLLTTVLLALSGGIFWLVVAHLQPTHEVGLASTLASASDALAFFALLGMDVVLVRTLQISQRKATDVAAAVGLVGLVGALLALGYVLLLPVTSPALNALVTAAWIPLILLLVGGTAVNQLTDTLFLAVNRVPANLVINGILLGLVKCGLPFLLAGLGAIGLYASYGSAALFAAILSVTVMLPALPGRIFQKPSHDLLGSLRFAGAGYATNVLFVIPQLVFPLLIVNELGASASAHYFVGFQVVTLLNAVVFAVCTSMYAEASRHPERRTALVRRAGQSLALAVGAGILVLLAASPLLLEIFGSEYRAQGTTSLRILALGSVGVAVSYWSNVRLRIVGHHRAMVSVQLVTTVLMVGLAVALVHGGIEGVAVAWGVGQLLGGVFGYVVGRIVAPLRDLAPLEPSPAESST